MGQRVLHTDYCLYWVYGWAGSDSLIFFTERLRSLPPDRLCFLLEVKVP